LASITYLSSPSEIASTGHSLSQEPHAIHSSVITYAIILYAPFINSKYPPAEPEALRLLAPQRSLIAIEKHNILIEVPSKLKKLVPQWFSNDD
jgi:hypothetical protein